MKKTILLIDDDTYLTKMMEITLKKEGYNIRTAEQGKQAIEIMENQHIDLIVVDLIMPKMDGLGFLNWLRQEAKLKTPALVQTSMVTPDTEKRVMDAGASGLIYKPIEAPKFIAKIQELENLL